MLGTIVAAIGTCGLYMQISLTREAVADTGAATVAMRQANLLQEADLRPWMDIVPIEASLFHRETTVFPDGTTTETVGAGTPSIVAKVAFTNVGKSPARNIFYKAGRLNGQRQEVGAPDIYEPNDERFFERVATKDGHPTTALMPGEKTYLSFGLALTDETMPVDERGHRPPSPGYAVFVTYQGIGIEGEGQTGKVLTFGREDNDPIDPAAPDLDGVKLRTTVVDRVRHLK